MTLTMKAATLIFISMLAVVNAHSYIICTDLKDGAAKCDDSHPYYSQIVAPKQANIRYRNPGTLIFPPVDAGDPNVFFSIKTATKMPSVASGTKLTLAWPADNHSKNFPPGNKNTGDDKWVLYATKDKAPTDAVFSTTPIGTMDYNNCDTRQGLDWTGQDKVVCTGTMTVPQDASGVTSFVAGWNLGKSDGVKYNYATVFQYNVIGGASGNTTNTDDNSAVSPNASASSGSTVNGDNNEPSSSATTKVRGNARTGANPKTGANAPTTVSVSATPSTTAGGPILNAAQANTPITVTVTAAATSITGGSVLNAQAKPSGACKKRKRRRLSAE